MHAACSRPGRPRVTWLRRPFRPSPRLAGFVLAGGLVLAAGIAAGCGTTGASGSAGALPVSTTPATPVASGRAADASMEVVADLAPAGATERARVVRVVDGDTLIVDRGNGNERLRYIGIDAPESVAPDTPVEFMGREAARANASLVDGREVLLERDVSDRDRFDRLLRYVWLRQGDGWLMVNLEFVREGYANAAAFPPDVRYQEALRAAERLARESGRGLWGPPTPRP